MPQQQAKDFSRAAKGDPSRIWLPLLVQCFACCPAPHEPAEVAALATATAADSPQRQHRQFSRTFNEGPAEGPAERDKSMVFKRPLLDAAAAAGQPEVCIWLRRKGYPYSSAALLEAASGGHRRMFCEWLVSERRPHDCGVAGEAARNGHTGLMDWLLGAARPIAAPSAQMLVGAAEGCGLPTLQRLHTPTWMALARSWVASEGTEGVLAAAAASFTAEWHAATESGGSGGNAGGPAIAGTVLFRQQCRLSVKPFGSSTSLRSVDEPVVGLASEEDPAELLKCYNRDYDPAPSTFQGYLRGRPVSLFLAEVWWSQRASGLPVTIFTMVTAIP
ncbi:hypothetical protein TSOC_005253 [Tetrabaena socialis]|uniref:Ankyrin repeat domain-containing protein n=1 Tax=Tetrabaena socialis TaxID=47790 RepID=A0A2J8A6U2_9CHLO|nr:hypothetical protein TSOC_005253 [Tetrabaena socialis]|eukprot:PNH08252.1 hypothetical protein TSOC_005253 [Tetrabaena socialis]